MTLREQTTMLLLEVLDALRADGLAISSDIVVDIEVPGDSSHGDFATNLPLQLAKPLGMNPHELAEKFLDVLQNTELVRCGLFREINIAGPGFLNFSLSAHTLASFADAALAAGEDFGRSDVYKGEEAMLEFFQPNIAKPLHVGHLRSAIVGHACLGLMQSQGYEIVTDTHYGDWGVQFGILLNAFLRLSKEEQDAVFTDEDPITRLNDIYVAENARIEEQPEVREEGKATFARLEEGDDALRAQWQKFVDVSLEA